MATYPSILAWKISWTEQPSRLQSMRQQRANGFGQSSMFLGLWTLHPRLTLHLVMAFSLFMHFCHQTAPFYNDNHRIGLGAHPTPVRHHLNLIIIVIS